MKPNISRVAPDNDPNDNLMTCAKDCCNPEGKTNAPPPVGEPTRRVRFYDAGVVAELRVEDVLQNQPRSFNERWYLDIFLLDFPVWLLSLIRFSQLLVINIGMHLLSSQPAVVDHVKRTSYVAVIGALCLHVFFWLIEENTVYAFETRQLKLQLFCTWISSILYILCLTYAATYLYVYFSYSFLVSGGVIALSVIYFGYHLYWVSVTVKEDARNRSRPRDNIHFNDTVRPETEDERLTLGPQLVYPVPREHTMPGYFFYDMYEL